MTAATMSSNTDLVLPGDGYDAFEDFLYNAPSQPQLLEMRRTEIINATDAAKKASAEAAARKAAQDAPTASRGRSSGGSTRNSMSASRQNLVDWDDNYEALKKYHAAHGNCAVPFGKETGSLRSWTERQKKLNSLNRLEQDKVDKLKALEFDFTMKQLSSRSVGSKSPSPRSSPRSSVNATPASTTPAQQNAPAAAPQAPPVRRSSSAKADKSWAEQFEALRTYRDGHGNCNVPFGSEHGELRSWTERQRKLVKINRLEQDKVDMLIGLGFDF